MVRRRSSRGGDLTDWMNQTGRWSSADWCPRGQRSGKCNETQSWLGTTTIIVLIRVQYHHPPLAFITAERRA